MVLAGSLAKRTNSPAQLASVDVSLGESVVHGGAPEKGSFLQGPWQQWQPAPLLLVLEAHGQHSRGGEESLCLYFPFK